ncbi:MAG TPA: transposase [Candidatus Sulfotelmatobacter sp.]|nr:transposase [Candidatus Sulfotelmatobacter sp.]
MKEFLRDTVADWDHDGTPENVRRELRKVINCGTPALGGEVFASSSEQKVVFYSCKSRFCPSGGARAASIWQQELEAVIPQISYREINFTMPRVFWPIFQQNRHLLNDLPAIGAEAIQFWAKQRHGAVIFLMVVQQTYGGRLNFYPHLHTLFSAGGFHARSIRWIPDLDFSHEEYRHELMLARRLSLIAYLDAAISAGVLRSTLSVEQLMQILEFERRRNWIIFVSRKVPKRIVIDHIGRYIRKPPIAQYRLTRLNEKEVQYLAKDTRQRCLTAVTYTNKEFLALLMPHIVDFYCNSMRYFGLLAPHLKKLLPLVFELLNQQPQTRPPRLSYAESMMRTFGTNPFIGRDGSLLQRVGRIEPTSVT